MCLGPLFGVPGQKMTLTCVPSTVCLVYLVFLLVCQCTLCAFGGCVTSALELARPTTDEQTPSSETDRTPHWINRPHATHGPRAHKNGPWAYGPTDSWAHGSIGARAKGPIRAGPFCFNAKPSGKREPRKTDNQGHHFFFRETCLENPIRNIDRALAPGPKAWAQTGTGPGRDTAWQGPGRDVLRTGPGRGPQARMGPRSPSALG